VIDMSTGTLFRILCVFLLQSISNSFYIDNCTGRRCLFELNAERRTRTRTPRTASTRTKERRRPRRTPRDTSSTISRSVNRQERNSVPEIFDGKELTSCQLSNEDAPPLDVFNGDLKCLSDGIDTSDNKEVDQPAFAHFSLDIIHDGLSEKFNSDTVFRKALRDAIRRDVFFSTPAYSNMSEKVSAIMLLPDTSLQGSWRKPIDMENSRMDRVTAVLSEALGSSAPTGDELMHKIGALCGSRPSTHWIDIHGVQDRTVSHSWHLDTGYSPDGSKTVLWGFPPEDNYSGCGVFSHVVSMQYQCHAPESHSRMEPIIFAGLIDEKYIVRPLYAPGGELLMYRDIDVLHSSPDVAYRASVMRFM